MKQISTVMKNCLFLTFIALIISLPITLNGDKKEEKKNKKVLIEEIEITGKVPSQQPVSTVSNVKKKRMEQTAGKNLSEILPAVCSILFFFTLETVETGCSDGTFPVISISSIRTFLFFFSSFLSPLKIMGREMIRAMDVRKK